MKLLKAERRFKLTTRDYAQLAALRHAMRGFLRSSEAAAAKEGLTPQHYQAMLVLRACPKDGRVAINDLAQQLFIKHNSAVGLVNRLARDGLIIREPSRADRRKVELRLTGRGRELLARLAAMHVREMRRVAPILKPFLAELSRPERPTGAEPARR